MTPDGERTRGDQGDWRPRPDPTSLTTEALHREVGILRELLELRINSLEASLKAESTELAKLMDERDRRYEDRSTAQERAVSAAFQASEKAISKAEVSIEKRADATYVQLNELQRILAALMPREESEARWIGMEERTAMLSSRVDKMEARAGGMGSLAGALVGVAGLVIAAIAVATAILRGGGG